jgi:serine/threonine protein kinase
MIGSRIGSYEILEKLGEGGMGVVYRAVDTNLDRVVAIKVLSGDFARNQDLVERFRGEAKAQANLNHTNLATLYAFLIQDGTAFMVMEFIDGETFDKMIRSRGPIPEHEAIPLFRQALLGIGYAHRAGIIHRDIKPNNLMLNKHGIVKVMDFGISKVMGTRGLTRTGTQLGTVAYMSPEQIRNGTVDIRSDIYELGVTLYEMLSGRVPFESDSEFQVMQDHVATPPPLPSHFYPHISTGIERVILKSLEKNPDARFQTVDEFGAALERPESMTSKSAPAAQLSGSGSASRSTVLEPTSVLEQKPAGRPVPTVAVPAPTQPLQPTGPVERPAASKAQTGTGGMPKKWIFVGLGGVLAAVIAVAAYQTLSPIHRTGPLGENPSGSSNPSGTPATSLDNVLSNPNAAGSNPAPANAPAPSQPQPDGGSIFKSSSPAPPVAPKPHAISSDEMMRRAQTAMSQQHYFEPANNSALYWAIQARKAGDPNAPGLETQIQGEYKKEMMADYRQKDYAAALALLNGMLRYYPGNPSLLAERSRIQEVLNTAKR